MDRPYSNKDVLNDERLRPIAYNFIKAYNGEWYVLREIKKRYTQEHTLSVSHVRVVLNSMLSDPTVHNMPVPQCKPFDAGDPTIEPSHARVPARRQVIAQPKRLKTRFRRKYGYSPRPQARYVHMVDPTSHIKYFPAVLNPDHQFQVKLSWLCRDTWQMPSRVERNVKLVTHVTMKKMTQDGWRLCPKCLARSSQAESRTTT